MKKFLPALIFMTGLVWASCKDKPEPVDVVEPPVVSSLFDRQKDTVLMIFRDLYMWNASIPKNFDVKPYKTFQELAEALRKYSIEPGYTDPVDKWSFAVTQKEWDQVSSGVAEDLGMYVFFRAAGDLRVRYVDINSPAYKAGVKRGWQITAINGNTNMTTSNADFIIDNVYNKPSATFTFKKPEGLESNITLTGTSYHSDPVLKDSVYNIAGKRIGYLVYNSFLGDSAQTMNSFRNIFAGWANANITDAVIDLRYNGGGYVTYQDALANYLAPTAANGKVMMTQKFNTNYSRFNETSKFQKAGSLNLPRIFFIVSSNTASASELLINNLKPYMDVKVVGPAPSYGKPVGYFPVPIANYYIFPVSFRNTNANGEGGYFGGFIPDKVTVDGLDKDWGDIAEPSLASAIKYITTGAFRYATPQEVQAMTDPATIRSNEKLTGPVFNGTIGRSVFK